MDTRLLRHYEQELAYLRKMGAEFAASYPRIAEGLGMDGTEVLDPYVERILEGAAFLSARVQLELELQYPAFAAHLFEIVYPQVLAPMPSVMIAEFHPDMANTALEAGHLLPRGTRVTAMPVERSSTRCEFRTAQDVTLWPLTVSEAEYIDGRGALVAAGVAAMPGARAALRLRLTRAGGAGLNALPLDRLGIYLTGADATPWALYEAMANDTLAIVARSADRQADWVQGLAGARVEPRGFEPADALLPTPDQAFDGYRLLREYFALPERFRFVDLTGLAPAVARAKGDSVDLYLLFGEGNPGLRDAVEPSGFALHCAPAINLFERRCDRVPIRLSDVEHHVIVDRTAPLDHEIYAVTSVTGIGAGGAPDLEFRPFYAERAFTPLRQAGPAFYTQRRRMRQRTERERLGEMRPDYLGSDLFLDLVDTAQAPWPGDLSQLAVRALVTNRDLPLLLATGRSDTFQLIDGAPVIRITTPKAPTRPRPGLSDGDTAWRLISLLSLNYLSLVDTEGGSAADGLREMIAVHAPPNDRAVQKQLEGLVAVSARPKVRRLADEVLPTAVRGLEITVTCDESFFDGASAYLMGALLERFFARHVTLNSFTETVLATLSRGEVARWRPRAGKTRLI